MKSFTFKLGILGCVGLLLVNGCQPPFQAGVPQQKLSSPLLTLPSNDLVSGVTSHHSSGNMQEPLVANSIDNELTSMQSSEGDSSQQFTPYPGYVPPPPALPGNVQKLHFPTLIQSSEGTGPRAPVDDAALQQLGQELSINGPYPPTCTTDMQTIHEVLSCMEFLPNVEQNEKSVTCSFEEGTSCRFKSPSSSYQVARFPTDELTAAFARLAQRTTTDRPMGSFLSLVQRNSLPPSNEIVLSTPITCQRDNGNLKFQFWTVGNPHLRLQVCTQDYSVRSCTKPILYHDSSMVTVQVVHPNSTLFDIELTVSNLINPTVFVIDNLTYESEACDNKKEVSPADESKTNPLLPTQEVVESFFEEELSAADNTGDVLARIPTRPEENPELGVANFEREALSPERNIPKTGVDMNIMSLTPSSSSDGPPGMSPFENSKAENLRIRKINVCQLVNCTFDGSFCGYKNYRNDTIKPSEWSLGSDRVGNPHTGIKSDDDSNGGFLYVGTDTNDNSITTYILESPVLNLESDFLLSLDIYRRSNDITLQICINSPFYCPYTVPSFEKGLYWKTGETFSMTKATKKFYLKAIQWRKFKWLAIDNIRVSNTDQCSN